MKRILASLTLFLAPLYGFAGHHEEPPIGYVLTQTIKSDNVPETLMAAAKFLQSSALAKRGVGMGLYSFNANSGNGATAAIDYYYPNAEAMPPADVITASGPHVDFFNSMRELGNEVVASTLMAPVVEVIPNETLGVNKVFYVYYLTVTDAAAYASSWKALMAELKQADLAPSSYGLREIIAGGENGETHVIWMGFPSMATLVTQFKAINASDMVAEFRAQAAGMRSVSRTAISSQLAVDTAAMFD